MTVTTVRIAIVGAGWWSSRVHAPALSALDDVELTAVVDPDEGRRRAFERTFPVAEGFADHHQMLERRRPDGVVIATPHATHAAIAADCLSAGAGVLVEKPFTLDPTDAWRLVTQAENAGLPIVVGHPYPFHSHAVAVRAVLAGGRLGDLVAVSGTFHSCVMHFYAGRPERYRGVRDFGGIPPLAATYADPALSGGGQGQTQLSHLLALLLAELPDEDVQVQQAAMSWLRPGIDVADSVLLRISDRCAAALSSAGTVPDLAGTTAEIRYDGTAGWIHHDALHGRVAGSPGALDGLELQAGEPAYPAAAPVTTLVRLLRGDPDVANRCDGRLAARVVEILAACYRSAGAPRSGDASILDHQFEL